MLKKIIEKLKLIAAIIFAIFSLITFICVIYVPFAWLMLDAAGAK